MDLLLVFHLLSCVPNSPSLGSFWTVPASEPSSLGATLMLLTNLKHFFVCTDHLFLRADKLGNLSGDGE